MSDETRDRISEDELKQVNGEPLPAREVMSIVSTEPQPLPAVDDGADIYPTEGQQYGGTATGGGGGEPVPIANDDTSGGGGEPVPIANEDSTTRPYPMPATDNTGSEPEPVPPIPAADDTSTTADKGPEPA